MGVLACSRLIGMCGWIIWSISQATRILKASSVCSISFSTFFSALCLPWMFFIILILLIALIALLALDSAYLSDDLRCLCQPTSF